MQTQDNVHDVHEIKYEDYILEQSARFKVPAEKINIDGKPYWFVEKNDDVILAAKAQAAAAKIMRIK